MSLFKLTFAGAIKKAECRQVQDKTVLDLSVCRKNYAKQGEEATFTWVRVQVWGAPDWMAAKAIKGAFVAGCGEFTLRIYTDKQGKSGMSADVRCNSFDVEIGTDEPAEALPQKAPAKAPSKPAPATAVDEDEPPFK